MNEVVLDFAGLADFEADPILWLSAADDLHFVRSLAEANQVFVTAYAWDVAPQFSEIFRWGDPRINPYFEMKRQKILRNTTGKFDGVTPTEAELRLRSFYPLHGKHVSVILPNSAYQFAVIPRCLGTPDIESEEEPIPMLDEQFNPRRCHGDSNVIIFSWDTPPEQVETTLSRTAGRLLHYVALEDHYLQMHMGASIDRDIQSSTLAAK